MLAYLSATANFIASQININHKLYLAIGGAKDIGN